MSPQSMQTCPECSGQYPIYANEMQWCQHCNWNLEGTPDKDKKEGVFDKIHRDMGKRLSESLFKSLEQNKISRPRMSFEKAICFAFAALVHLSTVSLLGVVGFLFLNTHPLIATILSIPLLSIVWKVVPKPRKIRDGVVARDKFPTLYKVADEIADKMGTSRPQMMIVDSKFNAFYTEYGFGRWKKKLISVGLPLVDQLSDQEIVAILSHETSHGANGDIGRSMFISHALEALVNWYYALRPTQLSEGRFARLNAISGTSAFMAMWFANIVSFFVNVISLLLAQIPLMAYRILLRLLFRQSQEAEYLADRLAAEVCGTFAMVSALDNLDRSSCLSLAVQHVALNRRSNVEIFSLSKEYASKARSEHEIERRRRIEIINGLSLDATHPPTPYRISFISQITYLPQVVLSKEESVALSQELNSMKEKVSYDLVDAYQNSLYYGA